MSGTRMRSVSLCMIVKDEEKVIGRCLESIKGIVDEIIVVDTGSSDKTVEIAQSYGAKLYYFQWNQNFSDARNFSISKATKEWILIIDADEYLRPGDEEKFITAVNDVKNDGYLVKTLNFNKEGSTQYIVNLNHRLIKNNGNYRFSGAIHENIKCVDKNKQTGAIKVVDVGFFHTGYLAASRHEKDKKLRNIQILEKSLQNFPTDPLLLFSMGNEYAKTDSEAAMVYYDKAYQQRPFKQGYGPKLVMFRIMSLIQLGDKPAILEAIQEGLEIYPDFTDLMYYRGMQYQSSGLILKAIESFQKCAEMGRPRDLLQCQPNLYTFAPDLAIGDIYFEQQCYEQAMTHYEKALSKDRSRYQLTVKIRDCLKKMNRGYDYLTRYFDMSKAGHRAFLDQLAGKEKTDIGKYTTVEKYLPKDFQSVLEIGEGGGIPGASSDLLTFHTNDREGYREIFIKKFIPKEKYTYAFVPNLFNHQEKPHQTALLDSLLPYTEKGIYCLRDKQAPKDYADYEHECFELEAGQMLYKIIGKAQ